MPSRFVVPGITTGEQLQGFPKDWTSIYEPHRRNLGTRWKMVGNAVTVGVAKWIGDRLAEPGDVPKGDDKLLATGHKWPHAAWGSRKGTFTVDVSMWPTCARPEHLSDMMDRDFVPLSHRAAAGFCLRLEAGNLRVPAEFKVDLKEYVEFTRPG